MAEELEPLQLLLSSEPKQASVVWLVFASISPLESAECVSAMNSAYV